MKRALSRALLGGVDSALAWWLAEKMDRTGRQRQSRQWTQAIQTWEGEGGRAARPADEGISLRDDALPRGFLPSTIFS
jgi:hypothetical protein